PNGTLGGVRGSDDTYSIVSFGCCSSACLESAEMRFTQVRLSRGKKSDMIPPDMKEAKICPVK
ncbi:hypothetical protein, partial [Faecalibaculum rodentium]|uniref:hypothetical protein n=1 Tax=Faecalibaculum rodentium TaxID=1702221 RepID=UPI00248AA20B